MASVASDLETTRQLLSGTDAVIAAVNSHRQIVVAGRERDVTTVMERAQRAQIQTTRLPVACAFHSPLMADAAERLDEFLASFAVAPLRRRVVSTVTGRALDADVDLRQLLVRHVTAPVRFAEALARAASEVDAFVEVGPGQVLSRLAADLALSIPLEVGGESLLGLLSCVGAAHALGVPVRASRLFDDRVLRPFDLDHSPRFLANPCEQAPDDLAAPASVAVPADPGEPRPNEAVTAGRDQPAIPDLVRRLLASRAELPGSAVGDDDRLLDDLHMSSVTVGQITQEALQALGLSPAVAPRSLANATVRELCAALAELATLRPERSRLHEVEGIAPWVRAFRPGQRSRAAERCPARKAAVPGPSWHRLRWEASPAACGLSSVVGAPGQVSPSACRPGPEKPTSNC
jgi:enediyne polyketide synthase